MQLNKLLLPLPLFASLISSQSFGALAKMGQEGETSFIDLPAAIDVLLPSGAAEANRFPVGVRWLVTVRILSPFDEPEFKFSLRKKQNGVEALVAVPDGVSIKAQLFELRKLYPDARLEQLYTKVKIRQWVVTDRDCPQLRRLTLEFKRMRISPVVENALQMDESSYEIWSQSRWNNQLSLSLGGSGPDAPSQPHALVSWAERARKVLLTKCGK